MPQDWFDELMAANIRSLDDMDDLERQRVRRFQRKYARSVEGVTSITAGDLRDALKRGQD